MTEQELTDALVALADEMAHTFDAGAYCALIPIYDDLITDLEGLGDDAVKRALAACAY